MPFRRVNRKVLAATGVLAALALSIVGSAYWLLASQLTQQKQNELYVAGSAVSRIIENYIESSSATVRRIADSDALEKYYLSYNALALRAHLEPLLHQFDRIEVTGPHGESVAAGIPMERVSTVTEPTLEATRRDNNRTYLSTMRDADGVPYFLFSYRAVDYFDEPIALIKALAAAPRLIPAIAAFAEAAKVQITIVDSAGEFVIDQRASPDVPSPHPFQPKQYQVKDIPQDGFVDNATFLGCDCVANAQPLEARGLVIVTSLPRHEFEATLTQLRWIVVTSVSVIGLGLVMILGLIKESNHRLNEKHLMESKVRFKSEFMAKISHELRTPLNAIIGYSELVFEELEERNTDELRQDLTRITTSANHLLHLINQILDLQKIEAGKMKLVFETFNIDALVQDTVDTMLPLAKRSKQLLQLQLTAIQQPVHTDMTKVRQVILNLLSNSLKFSGPGTRIDVILEVFNQQGRKWYRIHVQDQGPGIDEKDVGKLFKEFSQLDSTAHHNNQGTGLGLVINKRLCELLGARIAIKSAIGQGTRVTVELPAEPTEILADRSNNVAASTQPASVA